MNPRLLAAAITACILLPAGAAMAGTTMDEIVRQTVAAERQAKQPDAANHALPLAATQTPQVAPVGGGEDFGVALFTEAWGMLERRDGKKLGLPDFHEFLAVSITSGSIAQKAGLKWDDGIYEFDGQPAQSLPHLLELMRAVPAGKLVEFKIIRANGAKPMVLHAQF